MGILSGAAHLLKNNTDVLRLAEQEHKSHLEQKCIANFILTFSTNTNRETVAYRSFRFLEFEARGVRTFTTQRTGLWHPSVHSDNAL